jgi:hypothetical protein
MPALLSFGESLVGRGLVLQCQISWVWVRTDNSSLWRVCCVHTLVVSWWRTPALICPLLGGPNPTWVWYHSMSCPSNLCWACMSSLCWKLNDSHHPDLHILCQNRPQWMWRKLVVTYGATGRECLHSQNIQMGQIYVRANCCPGYPLAVSPTLLFCISMCTHPSNANFVRLYCLTVHAGNKDSGMHMYLKWAMPWGKSFFYVKAHIFCPFCADHTVPMQFCCVYVSHVEGYVSVVCDQVASGRDANAMWILFCRQ